MRFTVVGGELEPIDRDSDKADAALDDVRHWLGFTYVPEYTEALAREKRAIFQRADTPATATRDRREGSA